MNFDFPQKHSHELVLFFFPSPGLNWLNPRSLTFTTALNKLTGRSRSIGHVSVMVRTPTETVLTGMTQSRKNEGQKEVFFDGYGLGILLHNFGGMLEDGAKLAPELTARSKNENRLSFLRVSIGEKTSERLLQYLREFREKGYDRWYGMRNRPLCGEGGGCGPFAGSVMETAGILVHEIEKEWTRTVNVPHDLIGGPITGRKVSIFELLRRADRWAQEQEPHEKAHFWDPDLMHAWLLRKRAAIAAGSAHGFESDTWNSAVGAHYDAKALAAPTGAIFKITE